MIGSFGEMLSYAGVQGPQWRSSGLGLTVAVPWGWRDLGGPHSSMAGPGFGSDQAGIDLLKSVGLGGLPLSRLCCHFLKGSA